MPGTITDDRPLAAAPLAGFAATKIQPAQPRGVRIERPALIAALRDAALSKRVVLLHAPAGFGKTSALAAMSAALPASTARAWVSLDAEDNAGQLFACLAAALEPYDLPWRTLPEALVPQMAAGGAPARRALAELINALAHADVAHGVIVLEDLHRVASPELLALGDELIERLPPAWTLVLSSREMPPLSLARWRAADEVAEFGHEALRFTAEESAALLEVEGLQPGDAATLHQNTAGWPAGLRLSLVAMKSRPGGKRGTLTDRYLFDYLASEVLDSLPLPLHDFLMRTSVLPELSAARAAAVSGDGRAAERLLEIERRGLFATVLDTDEHTLVLHDLFRDALVARLQRLAPTEWVPLLERAAATEPDPQRRIGHLLRARLWAPAEAALAAAAPELFVAGGVMEVQRLVQQFDPAWRERSPRLARLEGLVALLRWEWQRMAQVLSTAVVLAQAPGTRDEAERQQAQALLSVALYALDRNGEAEALIANLRQERLAPQTRRQLLISDATQHFRRGQLERLPAIYGEVLDSLFAGASLFEWWECVPAPNWSTLPGMRPLFERYIAGALAHLAQRPLPMRAEVLVQRAFTHLWAGRIEQARADAAQADDDRRWLACSGELEVSLDLFYEIEGAIAGRADEVRQRLERKMAREAHAEPERRRLWQHQMAVYGVRLNDLLDGPPELLRHWAALLKEDPLNSEQFQNPRAIDVRARYAAACGRWDDAARLFEQLLPKLAEMDVMARHVELRLRCAHAWLRLGQHEKAAAAMRPALERVVRDGDHGHPLMAGPRVLRPLADHPWGALLAPPLHEALRAAATLAEQLRGVAPAVAAAQATERAAGAPASSVATVTLDGPAGGLSAREAEVLELMAAGQSNKLIARALDISAHTVKRHVANILDKLALQSRGQAAAWWLTRASAR